MFAKGNQFYEHFTKQQPTGHSSSSGSASSARAHADHPVSFQQGRLHLGRTLIENGTLLSSDDYALTTEQQTGFVDDFKGGINPDRWMAYLHQWGGTANNGVVPEYLDVETDHVVLWNGEDLGDKEVAAIWSHGERFSNAPIKKAVPGVRRVGGSKVRDAAPSRVGGCMVSRDYLCSGVYEVDVKFNFPYEGANQLQQPPRGVLFSPWTFAYAEHSAGPDPSAINPQNLEYQPRFRQTDGGRAYSTKNSEVDFPEIGKAGNWTSGLFNCYIGETQGDIKERNFPNNLFDGRYHRFAMVWKTDLVPLPGLQDSQLAKQNGHMRLKAIVSQFSQYQGLAISKKEDGVWYAHVGKSVDFYVDGQLVNQSTAPSAVAARLVIGTWFPSWAGAAPWEWVKFTVSRVAYQPFHNPGDVFNEAESYPYAESVPILPPKGKPSLARLAAEQTKGFTEDFHDGLSADRWVVYENKEFGGGKDGGSVPENVDLAYDNITMYNGDTPGSRFVLALWAHGDYTPTASALSAPSATIRPASVAVEIPNDVTAGPLRGSSIARTGATVATRLEFASGVYEVDFKLQKPTKTGQPIDGPPTGLVFQVWTDHQEQHFPAATDATGTQANPTDPQYDPSIKMQLDTDPSAKLFSSVQSQFVAASNGSFTSATALNVSKSQSFTLPSTLMDGNYHTFRVVWETQMSATSGISDDAVVWANGYYRLQPSTYASSLGLRPYYGKPLVRSQTGTWYVLTGKALTLFLDGTQVAASTVVSPVAARLCLSVGFPEPQVQADWEWATVLISRVAVTPSNNDGDVWFESASRNILGLLTPPKLNAVPPVAVSAVAARAGAAVSISPPIQTVYHEDRMLDRSRIISAGQRPTIRSHPLGFDDFFADGLNAERWCVLENLFGSGGHGVVPEYVTIENDHVRLASGANAQEQGERPVIVLHGHGERFTGDLADFLVPGVRKTIVGESAAAGQNDMFYLSRDANPSRVGAVLMTRHMYCSGTYEVDMKLMRPSTGGQMEHSGLPSGAAISIWTYHSEQHFDVQDDLQFIPLDRQGNSSTVLSEIDFPALGFGGDFDRVCMNTYLSNVRANFQQFDLPASVFDDKYHTWRFVWETELYPLDIQLSSQDVRLFNGYWRLVSADMHPELRGVALERRSGRWYAHRGKEVRFYLDDKLVGSSNRCVPCVAAHLCIGLTFPSYAGEAAWEWTKVKIARVSIAPRHDPGDVLAPEGLTMRQLGAVRPLDRETQWRFHEPVVPPTASALSTEADRSFQTKRAGMQDWLHLVQSHSRDQSSPAGAGTAGGVAGIGGWSPGISGAGPQEEDMTGSLILEPFFGYGKRR